MDVPDPVELDEPVSVELPSATLLSDIAPDARGLKAWSFIKFWLQGFPGSGMQTKLRNAQWRELCRNDQRVLGGLRLEQAHVFPGMEVMRRHL